MHFWLVLACHSYCLAYFPHAYRVFYFVLVIIIDVTYSLSELLGMCYHVYSLTPPKCVVVCTLYLLYSKVSVCAISTTAWGGGGGGLKLLFFRVILKTIKDCWILILSLKCKKSLNTIF